MNIDLILSVFGLAYIVGHSVISVGVRTWMSTVSGLNGWVLTLIECPACFSTWIGIGIAVWSRGDLWYAPLELCATSYLLGTLVGWMREETDSEH